MPTTRGAYGAIRVRGGGRVGSTAVGGRVGSTGTAGGSAQRPSWGMRAAAQGTVCAMAARQTDHE